MAARVTMSDVAARAGVSAKTVSNVLHGAPGASPETRRRVMEAVTQLDYRLNTSASALRSGRRGSITLAIPTLQQPLYAALAQEVMKAAGGVAVILELTRGEPDREQEILDGTWARQSDAAILVPRGLDPTAQSPTDDTPSERALVLIADDGPPALPRAACPASAQAELIAAHLRELSRHHPAVVGISSDADRWTAACTEQLRRAGLTVDDELVLRADSPDGLLGGVEAVARLAHAGAPVDAVVCHNDALAAGVTSALRRRGVRVPDDVAVIGRGDTETAIFSTPTLTSVSLDLPALASAALGLLGPDPTRADDDAARVIEIAPALSVRDSTVNSAGAGRSAAAAPSGN
ncbi:LacI family DNA-binding transcriptional regulator [Actinomyces sp. MRS3W]|uniref:LacI family DNA-binding transcriptional regulator n=1 Tax=Actinomyces sp. MRS3W TaxID=2800796 RepID=UPI0028FD577C|nr:LacI family DNA-binding transcriptional regulator [Actinomyces sp. MRS3W]MDU0348752.1 LacI family DNA-binding transcriptional regulator [Actinomyces sp. MRS3W]